MSKKFPITLRIGDEEANRLMILNKIAKYPKHQVKSKFFSLLLKDRCHWLKNQLKGKDELTETESEVLNLLIEMDTKEDATITSRS